MILLALTSAVWGVALAVLVVAVIVRVLYVVGRQEQRRRHLASVRALPDRPDSAVRRSREAYERCEARERIRWHDPARALRLDAVDPL